jgi:hypothetical protein
MFTGVIDSRDVRSHKGSSSQISNGSSHHCRAEQDIVIEKVGSQNEHYRQQLEYFAIYNAQQHKTKQK